MENEDVIGGNSHPIDEVNLEDEYEDDDDDLIELELEDVPVFSTPPNGTPSFPKPNSTQIFP
jgi:hypothetical protein